MGSRKPSALTRNMPAGFTIKPAGNANQSSSEMTPLPMRMAVTKNTDNNKGW